MIATDLARLLALQFYLKQGYQTVIWCDELSVVLKDFSSKSAVVPGLAPNAKTSLWEYFDNQSTKTTVFVLGNETNGLSERISKACDKMLNIPMNNGVESLNVSIAAGLIAFSHHSQQN